MSILGFPILIAIEMSFRFWHGNFTYLLLEYIVSHVGNVERGPSLVEP